MIEIRFQSLPSWPWPDTYPRRGRFTFRAGWDDTTEKLKYEVGLLGAETLRLQVALPPGQIRLDGMPRADAGEPSHPGVIVAFESKHGPLQYATDSHERWQHNIRAIALGLTALRAVDRYGVTRAGEQYAGWKQLTAGSGITTAEAARQLLARLSNAADPKILDEGTDPEILRLAYRRALKKAHPDTGGTAELLASVRDAGRILEVADR